MSQFVYLFRSDEQQRKQSMGSPEQAQASMQEWMGWLKELEAKGHLRNPGHPLEQSGKLVSGKQKTITDGPYAESKDVIGGYTLIEAKDLDQATELAKGCPIFELAGGMVEVRPVMEISM
jgi:hypothetical protein